MSPLYIAFVEKVYIFGPVTGIMHVCYFLYVSKCLIQFAWQHRSKTVCKQIFNENILLIKMYRTHSHISFLINFYRPNWTFYWKSYAVRWVVCYLFIVKTLAACFDYYWVCLMRGTANDATWQLLIYSTGKWHIKMNNMCLFALHDRKTVSFCPNRPFLSRICSADPFLKLWLSKNVIANFLYFMLNYWIHILNTVILSWH